MGVTSETKALGGSGCGASPLLKVHGCGMPAGLDGLSRQLQTLPGVDGSLFAGVMHMNSSDEFIEVDLHADEKKLILELAGFWVTDETTQADLKNSRKKWIRFRPHVVSDVIGELSYRYNRCRSAYKSQLLDELISHLEVTLSASRR